MPSARILLDTNTYLRLAKTIRPLLGQPFGKPQTMLTVIPELHQELASKRLFGKNPFAQ